MNLSISRRARIIRASWQSFFSIYVAAGSPTASLRPLLRTLPKEWLLLLKRIVANHHCIHLSMSNTNDTKITTHTGSDNATLLTMPVSQHHRSDLSHEGWEAAEGRARASSTIRESVGPLIRRLADVWSTLCALTSSSRSVHSTSQKLGPSVRPTAKTGEEAASKCAPQRSKARRREEEHPRTPEPRADSAKEMQSKTKHEGTTNMKQQTKPKARRPRRSREHR